MNFAKALKEFIEEDPKLLTKLEKAGISVDEFIKPPPKDASIFTMEKGNRKKIVSFLLL